MAAGAGRQLMKNKKNHGNSYKGVISFAINPARRRERRDCMRYYGDNGCLAKAADEDWAVVPCRGCKKFEPAFSEME